VLPNGLVESRQPEPQRPRVLAWCLWYGQFQLNFAACCRFGMAKAVVADIGVSFLATLAVSVSSRILAQASASVCICFIHFVYIFIEGVVMNAFACSEIHSSSRSYMCFHDFSRSETIFRLYR
jgi:hypothetical protein